MDTSSLRLSPATRSHHIAVIKYWGKRDETLILPINDSISVTLDPDHLSATTTVAVSPSFSNDRMWLSGKEISLSGGRYQNLFERLGVGLRILRIRRRGLRSRWKIGGDCTFTLLRIIIFRRLWGWLRLLPVSLASFSSLSKLMKVKDDVGSRSAIARMQMGALAWQFNLPVIHTGMSWLLS